MSGIATAIVVTGAVSAKQQSKASKRAAAIQQEGSDEAIALERENREIARADLQPFRQAGVDQISPLSSLISDPNAQLNFIQNNPFYTALADDAQKRLFTNQAAKGKIGSGGTAEALQNSLLLLGQDLLNQNIGQRMNLVTMGQNAAAGQATTTQNVGSNITDLLTGKSNALASGEVGSANAKAGGLDSLATAAMIYGKGNTGEGNTGGGMSNGFTNGIQL